MRRLRGKDLRQLTVSHLNTAYAREQLDGHMSLAERIPVYYAVRFTVERSPVWKLFKVRPNDFDMRLSVYREDAIPPY